MTINLVRFSLLAALCLGGCGLNALAHADEAVADAPKTQTVKVFDEGSLEVPGSFEKVPPKSRIVQYEFAVKEGDGEDAPTARLTMMAAGGGVEANIDRWKGQFSGDQKSIGKTEVNDSGDWKVHTIEISGDYAERMGGGPFFGGKVVKRTDYAMLGAILVDQQQRKFFVKMIGPKSVIEANRDSFQTMVKTVGK